MENRRKISLSLISLSVLSLLAFLVFDFPFLFLFLFFPSLFFRSGRKKNLNYNQQFGPQYCEKCQYPISPGWTFCPNCSNELKW
ncbi:MAG: hypothetical protein HeimC2_45250 [Candidatus Heimdallarchaeota archaeon LC_2]|nr:MAG: hypothetical protein HeimC2_45250 [Candidatus Heimdallarchaeota archaeon LC_2]